MQNHPENPTIREALKLAQSDAGKQLLAMLQKENSQQLQLAMEQASSGNYEQMKQTMASILASEDAQALLKKLGR